MHTELDYVEQFKTLEYYVRTIPASTSLTQSTIVAVGFSFFFLLSGSRGKRW